MSLRGAETQIAELDAINLSDKEVEQVQNSVFEQQKLDAARDAFQQYACPHNAVRLAMQAHVYLATRMGIPVDYLFLLKMKRGAQILQDIDEGRALLCPVRPK